MKKGIIIGGLVLVIGGVSYFLYMKEKKKEQGLIAENQPTDENTGATTGTTTSAPLPTGGVVSSATTFISIEEQRKLDKARDIFEQIKKFIPLDRLAQSRIDNFKKSTFSLFPPSNPYRSKINKLKDELLQLGYEFKGTSNPVLVKLNAL